MNILLRITFLIYTHHFTSCHFTYVHSIPTEMHLFVTVFLTLFLKVLNEHGRESSKWFQLWIVLFTNKYLPTSVICFLVLIFRYDRTYSDSMLKGVPEIFPWVMWPGREADSSPPLVPKKHTARQMAGLLQLFGWKCLNLRPKAVTSQPLIFIFLALWRRNLEVTLANVQKALTVLPLAKPRILG